jgi:hypothetical protein
LASQRPPHGSLWAPGLLCFPTFRQSSPPLRARTRSS